MNIFISNALGINDYSNFSTDISLNTSLDTLGASFDFKLARNINDSNFSLTEEVTVGNFISVVNTKEIFRGIIVEVATNKFDKTIKCLDYYFYLNKNKVIKQFYNLSATECIKSLLRDVGAEMGELAIAQTGITKIYKNKTIAEIIEDILIQVENELGKKFKIEIENGKFNLVEAKIIKVVARDNVLGVPSKTENITELKNIVRVVSNDQEVIDISHTALSEESIKKYGQLQEIVEVDPEKDISNVRNIAETKLKELNKIATSISLDIFGHDDVRAGRVLELQMRNYNLIGLFLIKSCSHKFVKGNHLCSIEVEQYNG